MSKLDEFEIVEVQRMLVPEGMQPRFEFPGYFFIELHFQKTEEAEERGVSVTGEGPNAHITLINWDNPIGTGLMKPLRLGTKGTLDVFVIVALWTVGEMRVVDVQMMTKPAETTP